MVPLVPLGALEGAAEGIDDGMSDGTSVEVGSSDGAADGPEVGVEVGPALTLLGLSSGCAPGVVLTGSNAAHPLLASTSRLIENVVLEDEQAEYTRV